MPKLKDKILDGLNSVTIGILVTKLAITVAIVYAIGKLRGKK